MTDDSGQSLHQSTRPMDIDLQDDFSLVHCENKRDDEGDEAEITADKLSDPDDGDPNDDERNRRLGVSNNKDDRVFDNSGRSGDKCNSESVGKRDDGMAENKEENEKTKLKPKSRYSKDSHKSASHLSRSDHARFSEGHDDDDDNNNNNNNNDSKNCAFGETNEDAERPCQADVDSASERDSRGSNDDLGLDDKDLGCDSERSDNDKEGHLGEGIGLASEKPGENRSGALQDDSVKSDRESEDEGRNSEDSDHGLSAYERMRLERVRRNERRLAELGLSGKDGGGALGRKPSTQRRRRKRNGTPGSTVPAEPQRRSRRSAGNSISYAEPSLRKLPITEDGGSEKAPQAAATFEEASPPQRRRGRPPKEDRTHRMSRDIYDEFASVKQHKRRMLKDAERYRRIAEAEVKHWQKKAAVKEKKIQKELEAQKIQQEREAEREIYNGATGREFLRAIEMRSTEIYSNIRVYDFKKRSEAQGVEVEARRIENANKLKVLDALDAYPRALKDAFRSLNSILLDRAPKDLPPPRRSKRSSDGGLSDSQERQQKKRNIVSEAKEEPQHISSFSDASILPDTVHTSLTASTSLKLHVDDESPPSKGTEENKCKRKRELNVGGWVSPPFSTAIDRSWLENDAVHPRFQLNKYVPQPGDTVLYYAAGHRNFLAKYPDHLARNKVSRAPLWERAKKEKAKACKSNEKPGVVSAATAPKTWWNDKWIEQVEEALGDYPIVCRVDKTKAEFPRDPTPRVNGGWDLSGRMPKTKPEKTILRLAVTLRALTPVFPPTWSGAGRPEDTFDLVPAPSFTVVTFPSTMPPFIIPFAWAYVANHSLVADDDVVLTKGKDTCRGKIKSFLGIGVEFGSFRLEDKLSFVAEVVGLKSTPGASTETKARGRGPQLPTTVTRVLSDFLTRVLSMHGFDAKTTVYHSEKETEFLYLLRSTLPLWNGVSVMDDVYDRKMHLCKGWDLKPKKARGNGEDSGLLTRTMDNVLAVKIEVTIDDFLGKSAYTEKAEIFRPLVTDEIAPYYSCAVPISMSFDKILERLSRNGPTGNCYYRSFDAVIADLNAIEDNCGLYNSADSGIVKSSIEVVTGVKKVLSDVWSKHTLEQNERHRLHEEKMRVLAAMATSYPPDENVSKALKAQFIDSFRQPYKGALFRDWVQSATQDASFARGEKSGEGNFLQWVPQTGDSVFYSISEHKKFIEAHYDDLTASQCVPPQFRRADDTGRATEEALSSTSPSSPQNSVGVSNGWRLGTIARIRAEFPRSRRPKAQDDDGQTFPTASPILAIAIQFCDHDSTAVIHWRPCLFHTDVEGMSELTTERCKACGVQAATSFLCPSWCNQVGDILPDPLVLGLPQSGSSRPEAPRGIPSEQARSLEVLFSLLKRRCIQKMHPDRLNPQLTTEKVKLGYLPPLTKVGVKSLPCFDQFLVATNAVPAKTMTTRGIRPQDHVASVLDTLAAFNFLPPWLPQTLVENGGKVETTTALHNSISPWPNLCMELVLLRLKNGFYRTKTALSSDILEAYATSALLCLAPVAKRKKNPISIKKLACLLSTGKYIIPRKTPGSTTSGKNPPGSPNRANKPAKVAGSPKKAKSPTTSAAGSENTANTTTARKKSSAKSRKAILTEEEGVYMSRLENARRLYGAALVCLSETTHVNILFGLQSLTVSKQGLRQNMIKLTAKDEKAAYARNVLAMLVSSLGRDLCMNRYPLPQQDSPTVRVKFTVEGEAVELQEISSVATKSTTSSTGPSSTASSAQEEGQTEESNGQQQQDSLFKQKDGLVRNDVEPKEVPPEQRDVDADPAANDEKGTAEAMTAEAPEEPNEPASASAQAPVSSPQFSEPAPGPASSRTHTSEDNSCVAPQSSMGEVAPRTAKSSAEDRAAQGTLTPARTLKTRIVVHSRVKFSWSDYGSNEALTRLLFGKPGRMHPCVRCQARKQSMYSCRVVKAHSNVDFDLKENFRGVGGLDGMFRILRKERSPLPEAATAAGPTSQTSLSDGQANDSHPASAGEASETALCGVDNTKKSAALQGKSANAPIECTRDETPGCVAVVDERNDYSKGTVNRSNPDEPGSAETISSDVAKSLATGNDRKKEVEKIEADPRDAYRRAKAALTLANELYLSAKQYYDAPARLSSEFISSSFPFDPNDGHYAFCIVCGISGDLMCCDGEGCPNVVHTACLNMKEVPEEDWYCGRCLPKKQSISVKEPVQTKSDVCSGPSAPLTTNDRTASFIDDTHEAAQDDKKDQTTSRNDPLCRKHYESVPLVTSGGMQATGVVGDGSEPDNKAEGCVVGSPKDKRKDEQVEVLCQKHGNTLPKVPPIVTFDEAKALQLSAELDELFVLRTGTGRRRGVRTEETRNALTEQTPKECKKPVKEDDDEAAIPKLGTEFEKKFGRHGYFKGRVTAMPTEDNEFYRVTYEDGDQEDLSENELLRLISQTKSENAGEMMKGERKNKEATPKRKRGRPRKSKICTEEQPKKKRQDAQVGQSSKRPREVATSDDGDVAAKRAKSSKSESLMPFQEAIPKGTGTKGAKETRSVSCVTQKPQGAAVRPNFEAQGGDVASAGSHNIETKPLSDTDRVNDEISTLQGSRSRKKPDRFVTSKHFA